MDYCEDNGIGCAERRLDYVFGVRQSIMDMHEMNDTMYASWLTDERLCRG